MKILFSILLLAVFCSQSPVQARQNDYPLITWYSSQVPGKGTLEAKIRDKGWYWAPVAGEIERHCYVQDLLEGRLNQPEGRGAIAKVESLGIDPSNGKPYAVADFGRGYVVGIYLAELALVEIIHD
jgi:hypothetical protein